MSETGRGFKIVVHEELLRKRGPNTRFSHFEGSEEELVRTVKNSWEMGQFKKSHVKDCYFVKVSATGFFCKEGARQVAARSVDTVDFNYEPKVRWIKQKAQSAEVIVKITERGLHGIVRALEIIDIRAYRNTLTWSVNLGGLRSINV